MIPDLKNKRIGYAKGSNAHYMLMEIFSAEGVKPNEVKMIPMDVQQFSVNCWTGKTRLAYWQILLI